MSTLSKRSSFCGAMLFATLCFGALAASCKKSPPPQLPFLKASSRTEIGFRYDMEGDKPLIRLNIPCWKDATVKMTRPESAIDFTCNTSYYEAYLHPSEGSPSYRSKITQLFDSVEATVTKTDGTKSTFTGKLEFNAMAASFMVRVIDSPQHDNSINVRLDPGEQQIFFERAHGQIANGHVLATMEVIEGITVTVDGKTLPVTTANGVSTVSMDVPIDRKELDRVFQTDAGTGGFFYSLATVPVTFTGSNGKTVQVTLKAGLEMDAAALQSQVTSPLWFVNPSAPASKLAVLLTPSNKWNPIALIGAGAMSQLGVIAIAEPGELKHFSPCRYQGGYTVHRSAESKKITAYNPRTGQVVGTRVIEAKAPKCDSSIGVRASDGADFGNRTEVDLGDTDTWLLSLVP